MNKIDYQNVANTYAKNVESLRDNLVTKLNKSINAYEKMYNIFKGNEKKGVGQVTDLQTKIKNLLIVNKDYTLKDKKKQHEISNINLRLSLYSITLFILIIVSLDIFFSSDFSDLIL